MKCRDAKLISAMSQKSAVPSYTAATPSETHVWPCWCALMSIVRMKQVLSHAGDNLIARLVILLSLFIFIKITGRDRCRKGSPELGLLHEERVYCFKVAWSGLSVRWKVLMIAFNYRVFTRCALVCVEHVLIPVPKLSGDFKHKFVTNT